MKKCVLFIMIAATARLHAQPTHGGITGTIRDAHDKNIDGATVSLSNAGDSLLVTRVASGKNGTFSIGNITSGSYFVTVSSVGYATYRTAVFRYAKDSAAINLKTIRLNTTAASMREVTVTGKRPAIEQKLDKMIVNVDAAVTNTGATALEVLEKSPGVSVDKDGNISLKGKQGVMIMIDGRPSYVSGTDLTNLLTSMHASQLDQIEIMTNPSSKYDAAGNSGIINIKTKKNGNKGFNGTVNAGYTQGRYAKTNNSINLNYRNGAVNTFVNYSMNSGANFTSLHIMRTYTEPDNKTINAVFDQPTYLFWKNTNNNLKAGIDYTVTKKTTIGFVATGLIAPRNMYSTSTGYLNDAIGHTDSTSVTENTSAFRLVNGTLNINLRQKFDSLKELSADADYLRYISTNSQHFANQTTYPSGTVVPESLLRGDLPSDIRIYSGKADYTQQLQKGWKMEAGWKSSFVKTDNTANYFNANNAGWEPDYGKTNHFLYQENINAAYLNLNRQLKKWSVQTGLRYENTNYTGHQLGNPQRADSVFSKHYNSLFPTLFISYTPVKNHQFSMSAGRRIDRPAYQDLNPFLFFINKYTYQQGNPFLGPQFTSNIELSHIFKGMLTTTLNYSNTQHYITQLFASNNNITVLNNGNFGKRETYGLAVNAQLTLAPWWTATAYGNISYVKANGLIRGAVVNTAAANARFNANNQFKFGKGWSGELSGFYNTKSVEGQFVIQSFGQVSAGIAKQVLSTKGTVKLVVRDILYTQVIDGAISYQNVKEHFIQSRDSRVMNITFTYRFGKQFKDAPRKTNGGASDEQNRVKLGG